MTAEEQAVLEQVQALLQTLLHPPVPEEPAPPAVTTAAELTAALAAGGPIRIAPGTYVGNFMVGVPGTTLQGVNLTGRRITPEEVSAITLLPADPLKATLSVQASDTLVAGLFVGNGATDRDAVQVGRFDATDVATQPRNVTLDSVAVVAGEGGGHRGIAAHAANFTLIRSHIANFWEIGRDSQAFWANNGPGPYLIEDNYLEGSGENILFGGDSVRIPGLTPSDIVIRGNDIVKPQAWREKRGSVKNLVEFKNARRVLVEGNRLDGCWKDAQNGSAILITPRNQYGDCPWVGVDEVTIRGNVVVNTNVTVNDGYVVNILGHDSNHESQQVRKVVIEGNLFRDARNGIMVARGVADSLVVRGNTFPSITSNLLLFDGLNADGVPMVVTPLTFETNVARAGAYGINGQATTPGVTALKRWAFPYSVIGNVIEWGADRTKSWPAGNTLLAPGGLTPLLDAAFKYLPGGAGY